MTLIPIIIIEEIIVKVPFSDNHILLSNFVELPNLFLIFSQDWLNLYIVSAIYQSMMNVVLELVSFLFIEIAKGPAPKNAVIFLARIIEILDCTCIANREIAVFYCHFLR